MKEVQSEFEFYQTKNKNDGFNHVKDLPNLAEDYSCIIAVGGDGTIHEIVNGMMFRADKKKVPIAFVPNGTGNDTTWSIGFKTVAHALEHLRKGDHI